MEFCPTCGSLLRYELPNMGQAARYYCPTCPYFCAIQHRVKIKKNQPLVKKQNEPVFTLEDMTKGGAETEDDVPTGCIIALSDGICARPSLALLSVFVATCPHCGFGKARFQQLQIRSADEPATTFYFCLNEKCNRMWRED